VARASEWLGQVSGGACEWLGLENGCPMLAKAAHCWPTKADHRADKHNTAHSAPVCVGECPHLRREHRALGFPHAPVERRAEAGGTHVRRGALFRSETLRRNPCVDLHQPSVPDWCARGRAVRRMLVWQQRGVHQCGACNAGASRIKHRFTRCDTLELVAINNMKALIEGQRRCMS
jgi:hypothetical protein